ncbi:MAG: hypothetical protein AB1710_10560 [Pseudomonadota bacterium]
MYRHEPVLPWSAAGSAGLVLLQTVLLVIAPPVLAEDDQPPSELTIMVDGVSHHFKPKPNRTYRDEHPMFALTYARPAFDSYYYTARAGVIRDSHDNHDTYLTAGFMRRWPLGAGFNLDASLIAGVIHRKDLNDGNLTIFALPILGIQKDWFQFEVTYVPKFDGGRSDVLFASFGVSFDL